MRIAIRMAGVLLLLLGVAVGWVAMSLWPLNVALLVLGGLALWYDVPRQAAG